MGTYNRIVKKLLLVCFLILVSVHLYALELSAASVSVYSLRPMLSDEYTFSAAIDENGNLCILKSGLKVYVLVEEERNMLEFQTAWDIADGIPREHLHRLLNDWNGDKIFMTAYSSGNSVRLAYYLCFDAGIQDGNFNRTLDWIFAVATEFEKYLHEEKLLAVADPNDAVSGAKNRQKPSDAVFMDSAGVHHVWYSDEGMKTQEQILEYDGDVLVHDVHVFYSCGRRTEGWYQGGELVRKIWYASDGTKEGDWTWEGRLRHFEQTLEDSYPSKVELFFSGDDPVYEIWYDWNGTVINENCSEFEAETKIRELRYYDDRDWKKGELLYDDGKLVHEEYTYFSGRHWEAFYRDEQMTLACLSDGMGNMSVTAYENEQMVHSISYPSEGDITEEFYAGGFVIHRIIRTASGKIRSEEFWENEKKIRSVQFLEDGSIIEQVYSGTEPEEQ